MEGVQPNTGPLRAGICSVTYRSLPIQGVVNLASSSGLDRVEWIQDAHVRLDRPGQTHRIREQTQRAGLAVAALGSYFRAGCFVEADAERRVWDQVLSTARTLGAPRIRVWAGNQASLHASQSGRRQVVESLRRCVSSTDIVIATEFHSGTLTDSAESARDLLDAVPGLQTYWQPPNGMPSNLALDGLRVVLDRLAALHVFSWWPTEDDRRPLAYRPAMWRSAFALAATCGRPIDALLEFVPKDEPRVLPEEASALRSLLAADPLGGFEPTDSSASSPWM